MHRHTADRLLKKRVHFLNLWRSVDPDEDVFLFALVYPDRESETMAVRYNPRQRWVYRYGMTPGCCSLQMVRSPLTPNKQMLIHSNCGNSYDSVRDGSVALYDPHSAFMDSNAPPGARLRESIEIRALVFYD